jgi:PAS domain-containing protein
MRTPAELEEDALELVRAAGAEGDSGQRHELFKRATELWRSATTVRQEPTQLGLQDRGPLRAAADDPFQIGHAERCSRIGRLHDFLKRPRLGVTVLCKWARQLERFFFHLRGPEGLEVDDIGLELADVEAAQDALRRAMPDLVRELFEQGHDPRKWQFEVKDDFGRLVIRAPFSQAPWAARRSPSRDVGNRAPARVRKRSARASAALANAVFRELFETSPAAHLVLTPDLRIIAANQSHLTMTGIDRDRLVGLDLFDAFPKNQVEPSTTDHQTGLWSLRTALVFGRTVVLPIFRHDLLGADGLWRERYWRTITRPIKDEDGSAIALDVEVTNVSPPAPRALAGADDRREAP